MSPSEALTLIIAIVGLLTALVTLVTAIVVLLAAAAFRRQI